MSSQPRGGHSFQVTHARVLAIAVPMTLANLTTPLLGVVGTAIIGQLGQAHLLGAVAISAVVFDCIFWLFGFLRMGTVALTAQALGANDGIEQRAVLFRALLLAAIIGSALILLQWPLAEASYRLMGASENVTEAAKIYFYVRIWSAPFTLANYAVLGWLIGVVRTDLALALQIVINLINIAATWLLVLVLELGVAGAAFGTLMAEAIGLAIGLLMAGYVMRGALRLPRAVVLDRAKLVRMLLVNRDIMIRTAALITAFAFFTAQSARAGETILAANAVLNNLVLVSAYFLDGFATAAEQLCGRAVGARQPRAFRAAVRLSIGWGFALALTVGLIFMAAGTLLIALMTTSPEVRTVAGEFLLFAALAPIFGVFAYAFDGIFIGATWTRDMRNLMLVALALYLAAWWALQPLGNAGLWIAILVFLGARGGLQALRYPALMRATFPRTAPLTAPAADPVALAAHTGQHDGSRAARSTDPDSTSRAC
ncbi:MAG TPA: MATE family efflux transporter [Xanthobacteraceae bacterium]|nr:MATE family efflux transporter [Xanthobacteraceae bacterium]